jgi:hypothetical protein
MLRAMTKKRLDWKISLACALLRAIMPPRTLLSTFTVLNFNDSGPGSLRAEITAANGTTGASAIDFASRLHGTITLTGGELLITNSVTINGPGAVGFRSAAMTPAASSRSKPTRT